MNRPSIRFLLAALAAFTAGVLTSHANLLINPSFEDSIPCFGWNRFGAGKAPELQKGGAKDQNASIKLFQDFSGKDNWSGIYQDVPVQSGVQYRLACFVRNGDESGQNALQNGNVAFAKVEWFNALHEGLGAQEIKTDGNGLTPSSSAGKWMINETVLTAPAQAVTARIVLVHVYVGTAQDGGSASFDDVIFEQSL